MSTSGYMFVSVCVIGFVFLIYYILNYFGNMDPYYTKYKSKIKQLEKVNKSLIRQIERVGYKITICHQDSLDVVLLERKPDKKPERIIKVDGPKLMNYDPTTEEEFEEWL